MTLEGACHCGDLRYRLDWPEAGGALPARRCACSYCTLFGGTWTSHPEAGLAISCAGGTPPGRYRFGTGTAEFVFCGRCGVCTVAICKTADGLKAVLNVRTLDRFEELEFEPAECDFEGETLDDRMARRRANWIGRVAFE